MPVVATVAALVGLPRGWLTRLPFALGWVGTVFLLSRRRSEGDYLVSSNTPGYLLLGLGLAVLLFALATLPPPRRSERRVTRVRDSEHT